MNEELYKALIKERETSNDSYAVKLVERIVFAFVGIICVTVIGALLALVVCKTGCHI